MTSMFQDPDGPEAEVAAMPYDPRPSDIPQSAIAVVRDRNEQRLLAIDGVKGVAIGRDRIGDDSLVVYIRDTSVGPGVPEQVEGYPVVTIVTGEIDAW